MVRDAQEVAARLLLGLALTATALAFQESFTDSAFPPPGWSVVNADSGRRTWQRFDLAARTPPACAYCGWENAYVRNSDWLITPQCTVATGDRLSFWCRAHDTAYRESVEVWLSEASPRPGDFGRLAAFGTNSTAYEQFELDLAPYAGQRVFLGLVYRSLNRYGLLLDDVSGPEEWLPARDVGVSRALGPDGAWRVGAVLRPSCRVHNWGSTAEWVRLSYDIAGFWRGDTHVSLPARDSVLVEFPQLAIWEQGDYCVTFATHLDSDQRPWNDSAQARLQVCPFQSRGGPDSLGYMWFDSDDPLGPAFNWQEISSTGSLLGTGDNVLFRMDLAWPIRFYNAEYTMAWVSTNGWIGLGPPSHTSAADSNTAIPDSRIPNRALYAYWDDLLLAPGEGGVYYQYFGDTLLVIEWHQARHSECGPCSLRFEAKLFRTGAVEFHYAQVDAGAPDCGRGRSATVGVEDASGRVALQYLWGGQPTGNLLCEGRAIRFLPMPPGVLETTPIPVHGLRLDVRPNPAGRDAVVTYDVPLRSTARVTLLDAAGRVVAVLADGRCDAGHYTARLDAREGRPLPAGVYFIQLTTDLGRMQKKLVRTE